VARRRYYGISRSVESTPARSSLYPDYERLFPVVPAPPGTEYIPFDATTWIIPSAGEPSSVELHSLRDTLVEFAKRDPRVQFVPHAQEYPDAPLVTYPAPPEKPSISVQEVPTLPKPPLLTDFLPRATGLSARFPILHSMHCAIVGMSAQFKLENAVAAHNRRYPKLEAEYEKIQQHNKLATDQLQQYAAAYSSWKALDEVRRKSNDDRLAAWGESKQRFASHKAADIARLEQLRKAYLERDSGAIRMHTQLVLMQSPYPSAFPRSIEAAYDPENRIVVVDYQLPDLDSLAIVKRSTKKGGYGEYVPAGVTERRQVSDDALYMIMLRAVREIVLADEVGAFVAVVVNGWMSFKDKATGRERSEYLMSLYAKADQIAAIDFANVDPKTCFRSLKGVSAPRPTQCVPIAPVLRFDKADRRIVSSREVLDHLTAQSNLAVMPWDDFEHLIREVFEKEFGHNGAEVRVTQASHDRGVDALVFDPDPVRGGKYVIQAKRYTMTVDVSSVRDLYGTVLNEGANRGILVTTSAYGPDAYEFAKDKPITLIDGSGLLHLLQKHGYDFRIDLKEARLLFAENPAPGSQ
jgi:restriction system protein